MKTSKRVGVKVLAGASAAASLVEVALILAGILPPVLSYSAGNLLFAFVRLALAVYAGIASDSLKKSALNGGIVAFSGVLVLCLAAFASSLSLKVTVLGVSSGIPLPLLLAVIVVENAVIGAVLAVVAAWLARKVRPATR